MSFSVLTRRTNFHVSLVVGCLYEGEYKKGLRHGWGKYTTATGDTYEGQWQNNNQHGHGVFTTAQTKLEDSDSEEGEEEINKESKNENKEEKDSQDKKRKRNKNVVLVEIDPRLTFTGKWQAGILQGKRKYKENDFGRYQGPTDIAVENAHVSSRFVQRITSKILSARFVDL